MGARCRIVALLVAVSLLAGCTNPPLSSASSGIVSQSGTIGNPTSAVHDQVRLPYFGDDSLNPYNCDTLQNYYLAGLLYDPLVALDASNQPSNRLAIEVASSDYIQFAITLRGDARFSDGSPLTTADVLYSLELARQSPRYSQGLQRISLVTANSDSSFTIMLSSADRFFASSLIFPILKTDTAELAQPVGIGRFLLETDSERMVRNDSYYNPVKNVREIVLVDTDSIEEHSYGVMEGTLDLMYSDLQSDLNLGLGIGYRQIPLSNLVYLRVNLDKAWATRSMRQIVSGLINREEIARRVYTGFGAVTSIPINPVMSATALATGDLELSLDKQKAALEAEGWVLQEDGTRRKWGETLTLELVTTTTSKERTAAAELIAESLVQAGIKVNVVPLPYDQYMARVSAGMYDLCIAETRIAYNMEISSLISPYTGGENPVPKLAAVDTAYRAVKAGTADQSELENLLRQELPVIPLLFRRGVICFLRDFSANMVATEQDIFYNIVEW